MANSVIVKRSIFALAFLCICIFWKGFGNAKEHYSPEQGGGARAVVVGGDSGVAGGGAGGADVPEIVSKALLCFNDQYIYRRCEEAARLNESGNLNVPYEKTEEFCEGPCLLETNLVLGCLDGIFSNFIFYNKATILDIKQTIEAACGYGPERGNFDVSDHMQADDAENSAQKAITHVPLGIGLIIIGHVLVF